MATTTFDNLITFSRGSSATLTGPTGLVQWAPMNLLTNSESFDASAWNKVNATISANAVAAPDGATTADNLVEDATTGSHYAQQFVSYVAGLSYTFSAYIKAGIRSWVEVDFPSAAFGTAQGGYFNLTGSGSLGNATGSPIARTITAVGNGWYRVSITATATATAGGNTLIIAASANGTTSYAGSNGSTALSLWGAQLELGTTATTYNNTSVRNLLGYSEAFDNAAWTKTRCSVVTGAAANPLNGLFNAQKLMEDASASSTHFTFQQATAVASSPYTTSVYMKAGERTRAQLRLTDSGGNQFFAVNVNLSNGTFTTASFGSPTGTSGSVTAVGNGWYRVSVTAQIAYTSLLGQIILADATGNISYTGDGNSGIYIYGAQLSNSASLDPYVPTPGAAPSSAAYYGPRFDYDPVTLQPKGLLVEEQRTNLVTYSEQFDNAAWNKNSSTVSANAATAPDGTQTADLISGTGSGQRVTSGIITVAATSATLTVYVKAPSSGTFTGTSLLIYNNTTAASLGQATFAGPTFTTVSGGASSTPVGNGWYRVTLAVSSGLTSGNGVIVYIYTDNSTGSGTAGSSILAWGAQLEAASFATSYIPTVASTVTRSADVATITGTNFAQWYGQTAGTFAIEFQTLQSGLVSATTYALALDTSVSKRIVYIASGGDQAGTYDGTTILSASGDVTGPVAKVASAYDGSGRAIVSNGGTVAVGALTGYGTSSTLNIGNISAVTGQSFGWVRSIRYTPVRAADFQLQAVTS